MMACIITGCACFGQSFSIGVIGGVRGTDDLTGPGATSASKRYVVGPALDIGLPLGFGLEADALYRREGYQSFFSTAPYTVLNAYSIFSDERANSWEFPVLIKYRLPFLALRPFLELGYAHRVIHGSINVNFVCCYPVPGSTQTTASTQYPGSDGIVTGGGVQFGIGRLRLSPVVRYTRWTTSPISQPNPAFPTWQSAQNQVDVLLSIVWKIG
jgi:hypothetical protein